MVADYNMSIRKLLKQVGVTSQAALEEALRKQNADGPQKHNVKIVLVSDTLDLNHEIEGTIEAGHEA
ncbi:MAG: DUF6494 family protein [Pseudomonadota bacterium]